MSEPQETVGVIVDFVEAERFLDKLFTTPELLGDTSAGQALATLGLGMVLLYGNMRSDDLDAEKVVEQVENIVQYAAMVSLPQTDVH